MCDWESILQQGATQQGSFNPWKGLCVIESCKGSLEFASKCFNPWKGLCVIESELKRRHAQVAYRFNPWKGLCVIERRPPTMLGRLFFGFQSLKGIMCDWELCIKLACLFFDVRFQSLKGIMCDWEWMASYRLRVKRSVSIPERDYVWLRVPYIEVLSEGLLFQSLKGIMCDWEQWA